jgi:hypothetical protein
VSSGSNFSSVPPEVALLTVSSSEVGLAGRGKTEGSEKRLWNLYNNLVGMESLLKAGINE